MAFTLTQLGRQIVDRLSADRQILSLAQRVQDLADEVRALEVHRDELYDRINHDRQADKEIELRIAELAAWAAERRAGLS